MSEDIKPFGIPIDFEYSANCYCRYCHTWGSQELLSDPCGNCGQIGYLIPNPFPNNMIPYVRLPEHRTEVSDLAEITLKANTGVSNPPSQSSTKSEGAKP